MNDVETVELAYLVVRKPRENKLDVSEENRVPQRLPEVGTRTYSGLDRLPFYDFESQFYGGTLSNQCFAWWQGIQRSNSSEFGVPLLGNFAEAEKVLEYSNQHAEINEIAVVSTLREPPDAMSDSSEAVSIAWKGVDIFAWGEWSLIAEGYFRAPSAFTDFLPSLNEYGLLRDYDGSKRYIEAYLRNSEAGIVEPIAAIPTIISTWVGQLIRMVP